MEEKGCHSRRLLSPRGSSSRPSSFSRDSHQGLLAMPSDLRYKPEGRTLLYGHTDVDIGMKVRGNDQWNILMKVMINGIF